MIMEKNDDTVTVPAGTFQNCLRLKGVCDAANKKDQKVQAELYIWYAPDVGWIKTLRKEQSSDPSLGDGGTFTNQLLAIDK
jgi:hypothetical protein